MGLNLNLKEKLQNVSRKKIIILVLILTLMVAGVAGLVAYFQYKDIQKKEYLAHEEEIIQSIIGERQKAQEEAPTKKPSEYKIGIKYEQAMKAKKPALVLFYADWCGYCIRFMPIFEELSKKYSKEMNFTKVNVEDPKYTSIVREIGIGGFPTVYIMDSKYDNRVLLSNSVLGNVDKISAELERFMRIRTLLDKK